MKDQIQEFDTHNKQKFYYSTKKYTNLYDLIFNTKIDKLITFIDNLIDIVLFLLHENDKINKIEKLYWNVGSPEIIKVSDIVHVLSMFFEEIDVTFKGKAAKKESKFVSTEKFISEFV